MPTQTCCVTGHRVIPAEQLERVEFELRGLIRQAIGAGHDTFISGFAEGADLAFARLVLELQAEYPVRLKAAIPYARRLKCPDPEFQSLLAKCSDIHIVSEEYAPGCFFTRNRFMVDRADTVIAVYDGRKRGGTYQTICYAKEAGKQISFVCVYP